MNSQIHHDSTSPDNSVSREEMYREFDRSSTIQRLRNIVRPNIHTDAITKVAPPSKKPKPLKKGIIKNCCVQLSRLFKRKLVMKNQTQHDQVSTLNVKKSQVKSEKFDPAARIERLMNTVRPSIHTDAITKVAPPSKNSRSSNMRQEAQ